MKQTESVSRRVTKKIPNPMTSAMRVRVDVATRNRFKLVAQQSGRTESELLRELMVLAIENGMENRRTGNREVRTTGNEIFMRRATVWMPDAVLEAARKRSRARGMSLNRWIATLIQASLFKTAVMTNEEILCLGECNYELAALGRNLNQIARVLNADPTETGKLNRSLIEALQLSVSETREAVRNLVRASHRSWEVEDAGID
ncbi:hypothetical protein LJC19_06405 [Oxalobacter sp. OttesenSCG-928-P03]|nr:hypothetical protein [Oxalobacter sp. OttesenSCG-928-P03]